MFKPTSGWKQENCVWKYCVRSSSYCKVEDCGSAIKWKNAISLVNHLKSKRKETGVEPAMADTKRKSNDRKIGSQPPLNRFWLLAEDMMEHCSAAAVTVSNTVDAELIACFADCKNYSEDSGLKFWVTKASKYPLLAPLAQDLLSAPASEAYVERYFLSL